MNINEFLNGLAANASRNFKIEQLNAHSDNEILREVVRLALDPFTQFYIRKIPAYKPNDLSVEPITLKFALDSLFDLSHRLVTGNAGIAHLKSMLEALSPDDAKVIERIIQKDLKCGVSTSTANAVWMGLIAEYPCMLCSAFEQKLVDKIDWPAYVQLKMDGMRFNAIVRHNDNDSSVEYRSRNGKEIELLGNLDQQFIALSNGMDCVFDGELLVVENGKILDRQTGNGILNKAVKGTISAKEAAMVHATVWDNIPYAYFVQGYCPVTYNLRFKKLQDSVMPERIHLVEHTEVSDLEAANELFQEYLAQGQEGIILKGRNGEWENKRSKTQIKFKGELECDLKIVGVEQHKRNPEWLGAVLCESADGVVKVRVGSGFNDDQRTNLKDVIGKICAVKYNARIKNKQGEHSLFLPIFVELRDDKDVADSDGDIK